MDKRKVFILTEGGEGIGFGHITRCSALYDELEKKSIKVEFIVFGKGIESVLYGKNYENIDWKNLDYLSKALSQNDLVIIDSYLANIEIYNWLSVNTHKVLMIDDTQRLEYPKGIVVNPSLYGDKLEYKKRKETRYLLGKDYIILRSEFNEPSQYIPSQTVKKILLTLGGTDLNNLTPRILKKLKDIDDKLEIKVIVNDSFHNLEEIKEVMTPTTKLIFNLSAKEMKNVMESSDFVISACGQTIHELLYLGVPFLPIVTAKNQVNNAKGLKSLEINTIKFNSEELGIKLLEQIKNPTINNSLINSGGSERVMEELLLDIKIRNAKISDLMDVYNLSNESYVREVSLNKEKIQLKDHENWFKKMLTSDKNKFYIVTNNNEEFLGQVRFNIEKKEATVSLSLTRKIIGRRISGKILMLSIERLFYEVKELEKIIAFVREENKKSMKLFIRQGFNYLSCKEGVVCFERKLKWRKEEK